MEKAQFHVEDIRSDGNWKPTKKLVRSMAAVGLIMPILVIGHQDGNVIAWEIVDGRRRLAAAIELGWEKIDVLICEDEMEAHRIAVTTLAANLHSSNPLSEARAAEAAGGSSDELWKAAGLSKSEVEARTRLLSLEPGLQDMVERGELKISAARKLAKLPNRGEQRRAYEVALEMQKREGWRPTVKMIDAAVRQVRGKLQPQMPLPVNVIDRRGAEDHGPDPVGLAALLRAFIKARQPHASISEKLEEIACLLETL